MYVVANLCLVGEPKYLMNIDFSIVIIKAVLPLIKLSLIKKTGFKFTQINESAF